jgi:hypothetical protein
MLAFWLLKSRWPFVRVTILAIPTVSASTSCHVPPTPLKVTSWSMVLPLEVIVWLDVPPKMIVELELDETVIPVDIVSDP